jgi:hypothetical protein
MKETDTTPIHIERNLYGDAEKTDITWNWYSKIGSSSRTEIETNNQYIYKTSDDDDVYVEAAAFGTSDTIQITIEGVFESKVVY